MANKKISELQSRTPALSDLILVGDPSSGYSYKCTVTALATIIETDIADGYVTIGTTQTISGAKTFSNNLTLTSVANSAVDTDKFLVLNSNVVNYRTGAEVLSDIGGVGGSGTTNYLPKFSATTTLANSQIFDNGTNVGIGVGSSIIAGYLLTIGGKVKIYNQIDLDNPTTNTCNAINIQKGTSISHRGAGYIQIASFNTNRLSLFFNDNNNYQADFDGSNLTTGQRYILPNATGTLALTSDLSSYVPTSRTLTINGTSYDLSANRTWSVGTVTSVAALTLGTTGTDLSSSVANGTTTPVITLNVPTASATNRGALSSTDWSTFNNKVGGSGTTNYIPKFTSSSAIGNSIASESGNVFIVSTNGESRVNIRSGSGNGIALTFTESGVADRFLIGSPAGSSDLVFRQGSFNFSSGSELMRLTSTGLGIGTSSPAYKLDVAGNTNVSGTLNIQNTSNLQWNGGDAGISNNGTSLIFKTYSGTTLNTKMILDASGNLGLGVTPSAWGSNAKALQFSGGSLWNFTSSYLFLSQNAYFDNTNQIYVNSAPASDYYQYNGQHIWRTAPSGTAGNAISFTQAMTLDASGNLGIGITSPTSYNSLADNLVVGGSGTNGMTIVSGTSSYGALFFADGTSGADAYRGFIQYNHSGDNFEIGTNGSERMRITSGGQVLINTTTATSGGVYHPLIVKGTSTSSQGIWVEAYSNDAAIFLDHSGTVGKIGTSYRTSASYTPLVFETSGAERMRITSGGNVGIGTSAATEKLEVNGAIRATGAVTNNSTGAVLSYQGSSGSLLGAWGADASTYGFLRFYLANSTGTQGAEYMRLTTTGLGIGTTNPTANLTLDSGEPRFRMNIAGVNQIIINHDGTTGIFRTESNTPLTFGTNGSERMRITSGGDVAIGTTTVPTASKLHINGYASVPNNQGWCGVTTSGNITQLIALDNNNKTIIGTTSNGSAMTLTGNNVGIGTSSPQEKFVVSNGSSLNIEINPSYIQSFNRTSATYNDLSFFSSTFIVNTGTSPTERMRITSGGDVTIGSTTASGGLNLYRGAGNNAYFEIAGNGNTLGSTSVTVGQDGGSVGYLWNRANNALSFGTNNTERMRLTLSGELLINTTSDAGDYKLQVNGRVYGTATDYHHFIVSDGSAQIKLERTSSSAGSGYIGFDNVGFNVRNSSLTEIFNVTSGGAIKTAAPSGGTAKPWKLGEAGVTLGGSNTSGVRVEIDGTVYYLVTGYLP